MLVSYPDPPFNPPSGKEGLVNIVQHFCISTEFLVVQFDWQILQLSYLAFYTHTDLTLQYTEAQQVTSKAYKKYSI